MDFYKMATGRGLMVLIDDYSRFPVVVPIKSISHLNVITELDSFLVAYIGFQHRKITPHWPEANGEIKRSTQNITKVTQTASVEQTN